MMTEVSALLREGIKAAKQGNKAAARELLLQVVELDDRNEMAWLWLSGVVDEVSDRIVCLENVLTINPGSAAAERGLRLLQAQIPPEPAPLPAAPESALLGDLEADGQPPYPNDPAPVAAEAPQPAIEPPLPEAAYPGPDDETATRTCLHCGTLNPGWRLLCVNCGKQVDGGIQQEEFEAISPEAERLPPPQDLSPREPDAFTEEVALFDDLDTRPQGLITLVAAWIAAIALNRRGAYEVEIFSASAGRSIVGVVVGGVAIPLLIILLTGFLLATSSAGNLLVLATSLAASTIALVASGLAIAASMVVYFYLWAAGLYLIAWLLGGKASFVIHAQLLSVAFAASNLLLTTFTIIGGAVLLALEELAPGGLGSPFLPWLTLLLGAAGLFYALAMHGQAISTAHRFSWLGGVTVVVLSALLYGLLAVLLGLVLIALSGQSFADLQSLFPSTLTP